jgi:tungstate transport system ATP-binding protein
MKPMLQARDLHLNIGSRDIFRVDDFTLSKGEVLAMVGPNGAGKSSLLLTLALLQPPTGGTILFDGKTVSRGQLLAFRRRMALVFQEALLLDTTVERNVRIPLRIRGINSREATRRTGEWLHRFGIAHLSHRAARQLSGGEAQRASLARAFALEPEILFLDEPFSALDYPTRTSLLGEVSQILKDTGRTTLFVTHDYSEIPYLAENAVVLYQGRIIKRGPVTEIFGPEIFQKKMWAPWER